MENKTSNADVKSQQSKIQSKRSRVKKVTTNQHVALEATADDFMDALLADPETASSIGHWQTPNITQAERDIRLAHITTAKHQLASILTNLDKLIEDRIMDNWCLDRARRNLQVAQNDLTRLKQNIEARPIVD